MRDAKHPFYVVAATIFRSQNQTEANQYATASDSVRQIHREKEQEIPSPHTQNVHWNRNCDDEKLL